MKGKQNQQSSSSQHNGFLRDIIDHPNDDTRRLIYAERKCPGTGLEAVKVGDLNRVAPEAVVEYKARLRAAAQAGAA